MKPRTLPNFSPFVTILTDGVNLLRSAIEAPGSASSTVLSRSASMHFVSAMHASANAILWFQEEKGYYNCTLARKFDRIAELSGLGALPDNEVEVAQELDAVADILGNPRRVQSLPYGGDEHANKIEFERTPLKRFNRETVQWIPEYSAAVLLLSTRFLNRLFSNRFLDFDHAHIDVLLGDHLATAESYVAGMDTEKLEQLQGNLDFLNDHESMITTMESQRWLFVDAKFELSFASPE